MAKRVTTKAKIGKTTRPVMALLELLGRRWALRILWELRDGPLGFRALQARCGELSPSSLTQRLGELGQAGVIEPTEDGGYRYSDKGEELMRLLLPLNDWANRWKRRP